MTLQPRQFSSPQDLFEFYRAVTDAIASNKYLPDYYRSLHLRHISGRTSRDRRNYPKVDAALKASEQYTLQKSYKAEYERLLHLRRWCQVICLALGRFRALSRDRFVPNEILAIIINFYCANSREYWNDCELIPFHLVPFSPSTACKQSESK